MTLIENFYRGFTRIIADQEGKTLPLIWTDHTDQEIAKIAQVSLTLSILFVIRVYPRKSAVKPLLMPLVVQPADPDHPIPISVISENQW